MTSGPASATRVVASSKLRVFLLALGWLFVLLGLIGIVLPVMPTAPFLLVAVWAFGKSSPKFESWILDHPRLGPPVRDFRQHRVIPKAGKFLTCVSLPLAFAFSVWVDKFPGWLLALEALTMVGAVVFVLRCPSRPPE